MKLFNLTLDAWQLRLTLVFSRWGADSSLIWPKWVCASEQGMVFRVLSLKQGLQLISLFSVTCIHCIKYKRYNRALRHTFHLFDSTVPGYCLRWPWLSLLHVNVFYGCGVNVSETWQIWLWQDQRKLVHKNLLRKTCWDLRILWLSFALIFSHTFSLIVKGQPKYISFHILLRAVVADLSFPFVVNSSRSRKQWVTVLW